MEVGVRVESEDVRSGERTLLKETPVPNVDLAMTGARPVIDFMFADFVLDGIGEIVNQIAKMQYMSSGRLTIDRRIGEHRAVESR